MKKSPILAASALAFTLGAVAPIVGIYTGSAYAITVDQDAATTAKVADAAGFTAALANTDITAIFLTADITLPATTEITRSIDIDLAGHNITAPTRVFNVRSGSIVNFGNSVAGTGGTIEATGNGGIGIGVYGSADSATAAGTTTVTVEDGITLKAEKTNDDDAYGLIVGPTKDAAGTSHAYGVKVNIAGDIDAYNGAYINGNIQDSTGNVPTIDIAASTQINANITDGIAIYGAGYGVWNIKGELTGGTGIGVKAGIINLDGATVKALGPAREITSTGNGMLANGAAIQIDQNGAYADELRINVNGGSYSSATNSVISEYGTDTQLKHIGLNNVTMTAATGKPVFAGNIDHNIIVVDTAAGARSTFSEVESVKPYLTGDQQYVQQPDGSWVVSAKTTTPTPVDPSGDGKGDSDAATDENGATIPNSGVVSGAKGDARATASVMAAIATTLTTVATGVVIYRNAHRKTSKQD